MRLMITCILATVALLVVYGLAQPSLSGAVAALVLVPSSLIAARSWFRLRPSATGAESEHPIHGFWMWYAFIVLLVVLVPTLVLVVVRAVA